MTDSYTVFHEIYDPSDPRLKRNVNHDSRSKLYPYQADPLSSLKSIRHKRYIPILDQGQIGCCVPNAGTGCLGSGSFWSSAGSKLLLASDAVKDEAFALQMYTEVTKIDPYPGAWPGQDTGSDGLSMAKVFKTKGWISGYEHALSFEAFLTALSKQPVIAGTKWLGDMFNPDSDGRIRTTGSNEGGHEYVFTELDVENRRVWMDNSWNTSWGVNGRAYFTWDDFSTLLADNGDVTIFTPLSQPAPTPIPTPTPTPTPPGPVNPSVQPAKFLAAAGTWDSSKHVGLNKKFQLELEEYLAWLKKN